MGGRLSRARETRQLEQAMAESLANAALPVGWEERVGKNGRKFYVNHLTQESTYLDPRLVRN